MSPTLKLTPSDRLLILAPHPDDESLATGALIQRAVCAGAEVRVLFASDGDNNPWPQRVVERRVRIGANGRERWGARRRAEALAALEVLGVGEGSVRFLGWPDQSATTELLHAREEYLDVLFHEIETWHPTLVAGPSLHDVHPDHNALAVQLRLALAKSAHPPRLISFFVHRRGELPGGGCALRLTEAETVIKRQAILCHASQMALSRRRFLAYARPAEQFFTSDTAPASHPIFRAALEDGALCLSVRPAKVAPGRLLIAFESLVEGSVRWTVSLQRRPALARIHDAASGSPRRCGTVRERRDYLEVRIPLAPVLPVTRIFAKYDRRLAFYDYAGWREISVGTPDPLSCSAQPFSAISSSLRSFAPLSSGGASVGSA